MVYSTYKNRNNTPVFLLDKEKGLLHISGRSVQLNPFQYWEPLKVMMDDYLKCQKHKTSIRIELEYLNSSSVEELLNFLITTKGLSDECSEIEIEWCYEQGDTDMIVIGECIQEIAELPFKFAELPFINYTLNN